MILYLWKTASIAFYNPIRDLGPEQKDIPCQLLVMRMRVRLVLAYDDQQCCSFSCVTFQMQVNLGYPFPTYQIHFNFNPQSLVGQSPGVVIKETACASGLVSVWEDLKASRVIHRPFVRRRRMSLTLSTTQQYR
jgi:hypothetical protein